MKERNETGTVGVVEVEVEGEGEERGTSPNITLTKA